MIILNYGAIGSGKTLSTTRLAIKALDKGRIVFSNYPIEWRGAYVINPFFVFNKYLQVDFIYEFIQNKIDNNEHLSTTFKNDYNKAVENYKKNGVIDVDFTFLYHKYKKHLLASRFWIGTKKRIEKGYFQHIASFPDNIRYYRDIETATNEIAKIRETSEYLAKPVGFTLLVDEAQNYFSSAKWSAIPERIKQQITQSRKKGIDIFVTVQRPMAILNDIRFNSAYIIKNKKFLFFWVKQEYYSAELSPDGIPDREEKPVMVGFYYARKWYKYYDTMYEIDTVEDYLK